MYRPFVHFALARPLFTLITAALAVVSCLPLVSRLGGEFLPRLDEGDLLFMPTTMPGASPEDAASQLRRQDHAIGQFEEVASVFGKVGRADTATDPAPFTMAETTIRLVPHSQWPKLARARWYTNWAPPALRRLDGAGSRADGHVVDRHSYAGWHSHGCRRSGSARGPRHGAARPRHAAAGDQ